MDTPAATPPRRRRLRRLCGRLARVLGWVSLGVVGLLLVLLLLMALPAGREFLLRSGLGLVARDLAGSDTPTTLAVGEARWARAGEVSLTDVIWTEGPDTLARIETLRLHLDVADLWRRNLTVVLAEASGVSADLPAIQAHLPAVAKPDTLDEPDTLDAPPPAAMAAVPFLRAGAVPPLPSLAVQQLTIARVALKTAPDLVAHLDSLEAFLELRHGQQPQLAAGLRARPLSTLGVSWRLRGAVSADTLDVALAPLHLAAPARLPAAADQALDGRLRLPMAWVDSLLAGRVAWPALAIDALTVAGDAGTWRLDARVDGRRPGRLTLQSELPAAPVALLAGLATLTQDTTLTAARLDMLTARWSEHARPGVDLTLDITPPPPAAPLDQAQVQARGRFRLPAPAAIASLLPPQLEVADLGPVELDLAATYDGTQAPATVGLDLDLGRTAWLDQARIGLAGDLEQIAQADLVLQLPGLALRAGGRADRDALQLDLSADLPDATLLSRWRDPALENLDLATSLTVTAAGPWLQPRARLQLVAAAASAQFGLPRAEVTATVAGDSIQLSAGLPSGLQVLEHELTGLDLEFHGSLTDSLRHLQGHLGFTAQAPPAAVALRGELDLRDPATAPQVRFTGDHLSLALDRRTLTSTRPWHLGFTATDTTAVLEGLQLVGSLGYLDLAGRVTPSHLDAALDLDLRLILDALRPLLPEENQAHLPSATVTIVGYGHAAGPVVAPWASASLRATIADQPEQPEQPDLTGLAVQVAASLGGQGAAPAHLESGPLGWQAGRARLRAELLDTELELASLDAQIPWPLATSTGDSLDLRLAAPALDLGRLAPLLPPDHEVSGRLAARAHVHGLLPADLADLADLDLTRDLDLVLAGDLQLEDLAVRLLDGTRLVVAGDLDLQGTSQAPLVNADLRLGGDLGNLVLQASARPDSLAATADLDLTLASEALRPYLLPEQQAVLPEGSLAVSGTLQAAGTPQAPWAVGDLRIRTVDQPGTAALSSAIDLLVGGRGRVPVHLESAERRWRAESLRLRLRLLDESAELLRLSALVPLPHLAAAPDSVDLRLQADALDLARLAPLLPAGTTVTGRFDASTRVIGQMLPGQPDPALDLSGRLSVANLRLQLPEGSRLALRGRVDLAGTYLAPQIRGGLDIEGGLLRLPDPPPVLLPASGEALLWRAVPGEAAVVDQPADPAAVVTPAPAPVAPAAPSAAPAEPPAAAALPAVLPDLVFTVTSPGGLWLRGQGLDVELAGDLSLLLRGGQFAVEGELQAIQGTMRQLGHVFRLETGRVIFDGSESELNPELDLRLGVRVGPNQIRILLGGTAQTPSLQFSSEPELSDGDILAILLFGRPLDELDEGQTGLLASRAAQIAAAYGAGRLQESLARQLGVDVVSIAPREGDEETTALTIGKYLSPRVMVRYEQLLRENSAFFVHLDYRFAGAFLLHTQVSQGEESGVQLKWQRDW